MANNDIDETPKGGNAKPSSPIHLDIDLAKVLGKVRGLLALLAIAIIMGPVASVLLVLGEAGEALAIAVLVFVTLMVFLAAYLGVKYSSVLFGQVEALNKRQAKLEQRADALNDALSSLLPEDVRQTMVERHKRPVDSAIK